MRRGLLADPQVGPPQLRYSETLVDVMLAHGERRREQLAFCFQSDGDLREASLLFGELSTRAQAIAALLQSLQARGDRTLLIFPPGLDFITAYFGCLYAGSVAVVIHPPRIARLPAFLSRAHGVCRDATPSVALTTATILELLLDSIDPADALGAVRWFATDLLSDDLSSEWTHPGVTGDDLAFLQYTSGSTSEPKGVMVSHGNLVHNINAISSIFGLSPDTRGVSWLPPYHDMGLIGQILTPAYFGIPITLMSPITFVQRPLRWLQAISRVRATVSGGPDFAYDLCMRRIKPEQRADLDLSCWEVAFNGAEPVSAGTLQAFAEYFEPCGFNPDAFKPCYGLAESTVLVSSTAHVDAPAVRQFRASALAHNQAVVCPPTEDEARPLVSAGRPTQPTVIVDPEALTPCPSGRIGEIWVSGPSVACGYWGRHLETAQTFRARLANSGAGPFLRTGDLGFLLKGELFVTGRLKDLIIIDGQNHYPQDIERTIGECHPALSANDCVAFSVEAGARDELVVVAGVKIRSCPLLDEIGRAARAAVSATHDISIRDVVLLRSGSIPKTPSGKVQRSFCRASYLADNLDRLSAS